MNTLSPERAVVPTRSSARDARRDRSARRGRTFDERRSTGARRLALITLGAGLMVVLGRDGSPVWQLVRMTVVAAIILLAYRGALTGTRGRRAAIAFGVGLAGTAVGTGIGLPHLVKNGLHPLTVAGLLTLGGGLVLLVSGGFSLVRGARPWRRVLVVPAVLGALFVVMWSLGQAVAVTNVPRTSVGDSTPADVGLTTATSSSRPSTGSRCRAGTSRRPTAPPWYCSTDPVRRAPTSSITPSCSPTTAMAC